MTPDSGNGVNGNGVNGNSVNGNGVNQNATNSPTVSPHGKKLRMPREKPWTTGSPKNPLPILELREIDQEKKFRSDLGGTIQDFAKTIRAIERATCSPQQELRNHVVGEYLLSVQRTQTTIKVLRGLCRLEVKIGHTHLHRVQDQGQTASELNLYVPVSYMIPATANNQNQVAKLIAFNMAPERKDGRDVFNDTPCAYFEGLNPQSCFCIGTSSNKRAALREASKMMHEILAGLKAECIEILARQTQERRLDEAARDWGLRS